MDWIRDRVWQLAIAVVLVLVGAALVYVGAAGDAEISPAGLGGLGLLLFAVGLAIPLVRKLVAAVQEDEAGDEDA